MILLAHDAAVSGEIASGASHQFDVINLRNAAGSTAPRVAIRLICPAHRSVAVAPYLHKMIWHVSTTNARFQTKPSPGSMRLSLWLCSAWVTALLEMGPLNMIDFKRKNTYLPPYKRFMIDFLPENVHNAKIVLSYLWSEVNAKFKYLIMLMTPSSSR